MVSQGAGPCKATNRFMLCCFFISACSRKKLLDISDSKGQLVVVIDNTVEAISSKLVKKIGASESTLVVCESSGGWENLMVDLLHEAKVNVAVINPRQTHYYAKAHGYLEKTDAIDARVIRLFGEQVEVHLA